ncbi:hypothetical protein OS493_009955 [Desmophyllum pertusum]|uniref:Uncharacterized protein n=1 Tax=Desmophyllum pertusum TaxID=174260 RepID=A0A9X0CFZ0_9CNID|nr:hypothetical protein OS493_009955 [Desmophyllum pertusum]
MQVQNSGYLQIRLQTGDLYKRLNRAQTTAKNNTDTEAIGRGQHLSWHAENRRKQGFEPEEKTGPGGEGKLDWLPITRNTIGYPYPSNSLNQSHSKFPERPSAGFSKAFSLPRHNKKGKKLTLSEAANLVPSRGKLDDALEKLTQELDRKMDKGVSFSESLLPSVSGTKLEVPAFANICDN